MTDKVNIPHVFADYDSFQTCLSILHVLEHTDGLNTKKKYQTFVTTLLKRMCKDKAFCDAVLSTGGICRIWVDIDTGAVSGRPAEA